MIIKNFNLLATTSERKIVLSLAEAGIKSVLPRQALKQALNLTGDTLFTPNGQYNILGKRIFVIGAGKASAAMAETLEDMIGANRITAGIVLSNDKNAKTKKIKLLLADHPVPSEKNVSATKRILALKEEYNIAENDLIIGLISGGGSSMLVCPVPEITLADKQKMTELLISRSASGYENTTIKSHLSRVKGGKLAEHFAPASILSFIISDDNGGAGHGMTASGPFSRNQTTREDVLRIFENLKLLKDVPSAITSFLKKSEQKISLPDKPPAVHQYIVAHNETLLSAVKKEAERLSIATVVEPRIQGEAKEVARRIYEDTRARLITKPTLFLYGGETTVTLDYPHKKGGRNQEFIATCLHLASLRPLPGNWCIASIATDGVDFIAESAGAIIDADTLRVIEEKELTNSIASFLEVHKTGSLLRPINSNIDTGGPTGTNVGDIILFYVSP
ncbi:MAG: DUF4147 domain-containing protein [Parcubacteria group bacterium]|nr:DUF4147 domain-containing protein [Parcubacteria group bacterium]